MDGIQEGYKEKYREGREYQEIYKSINQQSIKQRIIWT